MRKIQRVIMVKRRRCSAWSQRWSARSSMELPLFVVGSSGGIGFVAVDVDELEVDEGIVDVIVERDVYLVADPVLPAKRRRVEDALDAGVQAVCQPRAGRRRATKDVVGPRILVRENVHELRAVGQREVLCELFGKVLWAGPVAVPIGGDDGLE